MAAWGPPLWAGAQPILETTIPIHLRYGVPITSRKRPSWHPLSKANPSSDHNEANRNAYALDGGTFRGSGLAFAIAKFLGIGGYRTGTYTNYYITRAGARFRYQGLWAVPGHFNHHHAGLRLVSGVYSPKPRYPRTLKPGTKGDAVLKMKRRLRYHHYGGFGMSKRYSKGAVAAVKRFQRKNNLKVDGIVGPKTWHKLLQR